MIQWTHGFTRCDFDAVVIQKCGWETWGAVALWDLDRMIDLTRRQNQAKGPRQRLGDNKLEPHDELIQALHQQYREQHNYMKLMLAALADVNVIVSDDTLRTRLKQLGIDRK